MTSHHPSYTISHSCVALNTIFASQVVGKREEHRLPCFLSFLRWVLFSEKNAVKRFFCNLYWNHFIVASNKQHHKVMSQRLMSCVSLITKSVNQDVFVPSASWVPWQMYTAPGKVGLGSSSGVGGRLTDACSCCCWTGHGELRPGSPPAPSIPHYHWMLSMYKTSFKVLFNAWNPNNCMK